MFVSSLQFSSKARRDLTDGFRRWPNLFPKFGGGPEVLTQEIMDETLQQILDFLSDTSKSGSLWCRVHLLAGKIA